VSTVLPSPDDRDRAAARHQSRRRRRVTVAVATAVVVLLVGAGVAATTVLGDGGGRSARAVERTSTTAGAPASTATTTAPTTAPATGAPPTTAPPTTTPPDPDRRYPVGTYSVQYVDTTRATSPNGSFPGAPTRTLPTTFWFPAVSDGGPPDRADGPYPLVLFVHGYNVTPDFYAPMLERWASAGYVVAGPRFPILSGQPGGASHVDYDQLFGDASFVISQTLASGRDTPIGGLVDPTRIAAAGHSDGEMVTFTLGFASCCREGRVKSVIAMAGDLSNAGVDPMRDTGLPILHVMETNDEYDPYQHSIDWDQQNLTPPRWMVTLLGASHVPPYTQPGNPYFELVSAATIDFLDGTLKGNADHLARVTTDVAAHPDLASLQR